LTSGFRMTPSSFAALYQIYFIPAAIILLVFGALGWYLIRWSQNLDYGKRFNFNTFLTMLAIAIAIALIATAVIALQNSSRLPYDYMPVPKFTPFNYY